MANIFNSVKGLNPRRNSFSAHTYRNDLTGYLGVDIPIYQQHVLPGSFIKCSASGLIRLQALIAPIMDNIDFYVHFWKLPYRLIEGDRFTQFISGEIAEADYSSVFLTPSELLDSLLAAGQHWEEEGTAIETIATKVLKIVSNGELLDYLGYDAKLFHHGNLEPVLGVEGAFHFADANNTTKLNFRPLIAYWMMHLNWYMNENVPYFLNFDQHVQDLIDNVDSDNVAYILYKIYLQFGTSVIPHSWDKDYFTSALPNVQYGSPVTISLAGTADVNIPPQTVIQNPITSPTELDYIQFGLNDRFNSDDTLNYQHVGNDNGKLNVGLGEPSISVSQIVSQLEGNTLDKSLVASADLSNVSVITINELRFANALQVFKERQLRYGRRRQEYYKGFYNVSPEDLRLQLPKYLGGGRIPINISDIEQTSSTTGSSALGHLAGKGTAVAGGFAGFKTYCSEESIILGIGFAIPHITYSNHISKFLLKTNDIYDYFNPSFEHLGEQAIQNIEVYSGSLSPNSTFGYTPRYNEYRFHANEQHGEFKASLSYWTLGRIFSSQPTLSPQFIYMQPSVFNRIFAVSGQPSMLASFVFRQRIVQPVSKYGTPMLLA